jgi:hypothetical protein
MDAEGHSGVQESKLAKQLLKVFMLALQRPKFFEGLLTNPQDALHSAGFLLTPEELNEVIQHLTKTWEITELQSFHFFREILINLINQFADRDVSPKPPPPPPPPGWWLSEQFLIDGIGWAESKIVKIGKSKQRPKTKTKSVLKRKAKYR